jgi:putative peptidoglycan lipid II flippase
MDVGQGEPGQETQRYWYDQDATMIMPVVPPDATAILPAQAPTQPIGVPPRHAAQHAWHAQPPAETPTQAFHSQAYRSQAYAGQFYGGGPYSGEEPTLQLPVVPPIPPSAGPTTGPTAGTGGTEPPAEDQARSLARNSAVMAAGSIASRITGLLRTVIIAAAIGAKIVAGDYTLANTLPNMVYELLLGGVMSSVIVPLLMRARTRDEDKGEAYAQRLLSLATIFLGAATLAAVAAAPLLTVLFRTSKNTAADSHLITVLSYLLLPEIFFYGVAALVAAILNTRGHFAAPMWTPILNNIVVILTAGLFMLLPTASGTLTPETITALQVLVLGGGTTLGIVAQAAGLFPALRKVGFRWRWRWDWRQLQLRQLAHTSAWMLGYVIVNQISVAIILKISNLALHNGGSGPIVYSNAYLIFMMANGIVAVSIMTALMPRMSAAAAQQRFKDLTEHLSLGIRLSSVILIPATVAYLVLGRQLAVTIFDWGKYQQQDAIWTGWVIAAAGLGLVPYALTQMQLFAFYAMPDTKTPTLLNVPICIFRVLLTVLLYRILPAVWVNAGLMIAMAVSYVIAAVIGNWLLRKRIGELGFGPVLRTLLRLALAAAVAAVPTALITLIVQHLLGLGKAGSIVGLLLGAVVLVVVYLAAAVALQVKEISQVWGMVRGRVRR